MPERTYTEHEIAAIFEQASERQTGTSGRDASPGLTLAEVELAGREAGLDPAAVRAAAAALDAGIDRPARSGRVVAERWIDEPLSAGAWEDLVGSLRLRFGSSSQWWTADTTTLGAAQEWTHTAMSGLRTTVTLSPREEATLLRVQQEDAGLEDERTMGWVVAAFFAAIPSMLTGALVAETFGFGDLAGIVAMLAVFAASAALGAPRVTARMRRARARLAQQVERVADDLAVQLGEATPRPAAHDASEPPAPRLDLSALAEPPPDAEPLSKRRRTRS